MQAVTIVFCCSPFTLFARVTTRANILFKAIITIPNKAVFFNKLIERSLHPIPTHPTHRQKPGGLKRSPGLKEIS